MHVRAGAKINLCLAITGQRGGYHLLDSIMQEIDLCDELEIVPAASTRLTVLGGPPLPQENTAVRAASLFFAAAGRPGGAEIVLRKRIPQQAGLGGGSSDGAAVLKALNAFHGYPLSEAELASCALTLGADCPFFLRGGTQRAQGIGEILTPLHVPADLPLLLVKPPRGVPTGSAFAAADVLPPVHVDTEACVRALEAGDLPSYFAAAANALQPAAAGMVPEIEQLGRICLDLGAVFWLMSGSGSCLFAVFPDTEVRRRAFERVRRDGRLFVAETQMRIH